MNSKSLPVFILRKIVGFLTITLILFPGGQSAMAQHIPGRKARISFEKASVAASVYDHAKALNYLYSAVSMDSLYTDAWVLMGDLYLHIGEDRRAVEAYSRALELNPAHKEDLLLMLARTELGMGMYESSGKHFSAFQRLAQPVGETARFVGKMLKRVDFALEAIENPVPFHPIHLGERVNSPYDDFINALRIDGMSLLLTIKAPPSFHGLSTGTRETEDFYIADRDSSGWQCPRNLGTPVNTAGNEGALSLSPDGRYIFFAGCDRTDSYGRCDLYVSNRDGNQWGTPVNLGSMVNSAAWESQPSVSSDGKTLFFASNRPGGYGQTDLWFSTINNDGTFCAPVNLGKTINTEGSEMAPFIHPDGKTLYFSSDGHLGMGGKDLFYTRKFNDTLWSTPVNLGYPINTYADEMTLVVGPEGTIAYFSSDKLGGLGRYDIYSFALYDEAQPSPVTYLQGKVYDAETKTPLKAYFTLTDLQSGEERIASYSDARTGEFLVCLPAGNDYLLAARREGYLYYSDQFFLKANHLTLTPFIKDVPLFPVRSGESFVTRNIFFDTDKYLIKPESNPELQLVSELLTRNPEISLEIIGHTDNTGERQHNKILSENRAQAVYHRLIEMGIAASRLSYKGMGSTNPVSANDTPEGRAKNRRTEFVIH